VDHDLDDLYDVALAPARRALCRVGLDWGAKWVAGLPGAVPQDNAGRAAVRARPVAELSFQMSKAGFPAHERASPRDEEFSKKPRVFAAN
jgi:hypothetical protein